MKKLSQLRKSHRSVKSINGGQAMHRNGSQSIGNVGFQYRAHGGRCLAPPDSGVAKPRLDKAGPKRRADGGPAHQSVPLERERRSDIRERAPMSLAPIPEVPMSPVALGPLTGMSFQPMERVAVGDVADLGGPELPPPPPPEMRKRGGRTNKKGA